MFIDSIYVNHNYKKILESDWLSPATICNGNWTEWSTIQSIIGRAILNRPSGRPILLITGMITDRIGLHSVLLPLLIVKTHWLMSEKFLLPTKIQLYTCRKSTCDSVTETKFLQTHRYLKILQFLYAVIIYFFFHQVFSNMKSIITSLG